MQTPGGAAFEKDCVCTVIDISPVQGARNGDSTAVNSCRKLSATGDFLNATGKRNENLLLFVCNELTPRL